MGTPQYAGFGSRAPTRPPPQNWQQQEEADAQNQWNDQGQQTLADQARSGTERTTQRNAADRAYDSFTGGSATNVAAYRPLNLEGYSPNQVQFWQMAAAGAGGMAGGSRSSSAAGAGGSANLAGFNSDELRKFDSSDVSNFDPTSFGKTFAQGAQQEYSTSLNDKLHQLENQGAGTGRLKTGFYTRDQGDVVTRTTNDLNSKLAQAATTFSGQRLGALESGAGMRLSRAQGIDSNMLSRAGQMDQNALEGGRSADSFALATQGNDLERSRMQLGAAQGQDEMAYRRSSDIDKYGYDAAQYQDTQNFNRGTTGLDAALGRESRYMTDYQQTADRASSYASANRDWAAQDRETQDQRDVMTNEQQRLNARRNTVGGTPWSDQTAEGLARKQAALYGVPYRG